MAKLEMINVCPNCGGKLEKLRNMYRCESCRTEFKSERVKDPNPKIGTAEDGFIKTSWFDFKTDMKKLSKGPDSKTTLHTFNYCINELGTSDAIMDYINSMLLPDCGIYAPGIKDDKIAGFVKRLHGKITPSDNILYYANTGIFSTGKQGFIITDEKIVFSEKNTPQLYFTELSEIGFETDDDFVGVHLNNSSTLQIYNISGGSFKPHGAFAALIAALSFEESPDRDKIVISRYKLDI
ncbi:MAG: hypothetical protein IJ619_01385 [Eubacterium sp.]|nr:hypothetical protein [Eubacterium sp.]